MTLKIIWIFSKNLHLACEALKDKVGVRAARAAALTIADPIRDKKPDMELTRASRVSKHCAVRKASTVDNTEITLYNALKHITKKSLYLHFALNKLILNKVGDVMVAQLHKLEAGRADDDEH